MSLRDYFAAKVAPIALQHAIAEVAADGDRFAFTEDDDMTPSGECEVAAAYAYAMADALLKARADHE